MVAVRAPDWAHDGHEARVCPVADVHAAGVRHVDEGSALGGSVEAAPSVEACRYSRTPAARGCIRVARSASNPLGPTPSRRCQHPTLG